ncbi:GGDEF domain-containing protein, partial [Methylogaea oryzae]|uniref:GGDEF domain-containing protein n=1 Tax=Methylogaea oryzae TaxID=1295382 RepID=UPI0026E5726E
MKVIFYVSHATLTLLYERDTVAFFDASQLQSFGWLGAIVLLITDTFGYVLLTANRSRNELSRFALQDPLTGLANRRAFDTRLAANIADAGRGGTALSCSCSIWIISSKSTTATATPPGIKCFAISPSWAAPRPAATTTSPASAAKNSPWWRQTPTSPPRWKS